MLVFTSPPPITVVTDFYLGSGELDSCSCAYTASAFVTKSSAWPFWEVFYKCGILFLNVDNTFLEIGRVVFFSGLYAHYFLLCVVLLRAKTLSLNKVMSTL